MAKKYEIPSLSKRIQIVDINNQHKRNNDTRRRNRETQKIAVWRKITI
jgi:hypothetical protein